MHNLHTTLKYVQESPVYKAWLSDHPSSYLSSFFKIIEHQDVDWWQVDFYYPKGDTITSFVVDDKVKLATKDAAVFKKPDTSVKALDLAMVKIDMAHALRAAQELQKEKYKGEKTSKTVVLLQTLAQTFWKSEVEFINIVRDANIGTNLLASLHIAKDTHFGTFWCPLL